MPLVANAMEAEDVEMFRGSETLRCAASRPFYARDVRKRVVVSGAAGALPITRLKRC